MPQRHKLTALWKFTEENCMRLVRRNETETLMSLLLLAYYYDTLTATEKSSAQGERKNC
jgi:hypothetical protein